MPLSSDHWWREAASDGLVSIQNHSWDHLHPVLPVTMLEGRTAGNFYSVDSFEHADLQVKKAGESIRVQLGEFAPDTHLFAYPFGHAGEYLTEDYLPNLEGDHAVVAAFTTEQGFIESDAARYRLPRLVCGDAWNSPSGFTEIMRNLAVS